MKTSKLILPAIFTVVILMIYFLYFAPTDELGSFSKFSPGSEINQEINLAVVKQKDFERNENGGIISFYAQDINNVEMKVTSHEPIPANVISSAEIVEVLGHIHGNTLTASRVSIVK